MRFADIYPCLESVSDKRIKVSVLIKQKQKISQGNWKQLPPHSEKQTNKQTSLNYIGAC